LIYLDNAATSFPKAPGVAAAVARSLESPQGNAGRPSSIAGLGANRIAFEAREELAALLGVPDSRRIAFAKNATEALNLAILGAVPTGGLLALSGLEHNSVMRPARRLEAERGVRLLFFPCDGLGRPDPGLLAEAIAARPDLLVLTAASNVTGAVTPFEEVARDCRAAGVPCLVDGSQAAGHFPIRLGDTAISAFCFAGHKALLGPEGTGGLWTAEGFDPLPLICGGTGSDSASELQPLLSPDRYEAGTQNAPALAGLLEAARFLSRTGLGEVERREAALRDRLVGGLTGIPRLSLLGPGAGARSTPLLSLAAEGISPAEFALELGERGIAARPGLHCAPAAHRALGTLGSGGTLRLSPGFFTTESEIDEAVAAMKEMLA
jgi:cysteine desulfurase / selenocysteine lyase